MTTKTINIVDYNLLLGSSELIRQALGGYWEDGGTVLTAVDASQNEIIESFDSNYAGTNVAVDPESLIDSVRYASRIYGTSDTSRIRSDEEWSAYVAGGSYAATAYEGIYNEAIYFDHKTQIQLPLFNDELQSDNDEITGQSVAEYYNYYERYQNNLTQVASEHLLPNFYFLIAQDIDDLDVAKMITLDGTIDEDYFNYISFQDELQQEQPELVERAYAQATAIEAAAKEASLGMPAARAARLRDAAAARAAATAQQQLYYTEVSDPTGSSQFNTLFSSVASDKGVPRYSYNNIKDYLNVSYVNHTYQDSTAQRLQTRLQNIMFLEPSVLNEHNDQLIATDFSFLKDDKKQSVYSLMPMANDINFEVDDSVIGSGLRSIIETNDYAPRFLKTLKEIFADEISLKPTAYEFAINDEYSQEVATRTLNIVDLPEMVLYDYENLLSRTNNAYYYGNSTPPIKACFDNTGAYRFVNSEIAINTLNDVVGMINTNFSPPESLENFLNDPLQSQKQHEVLAYRVQKIGGPPTGDSRTENTLQNFWFLNKGEAIKYVDTQVKYGTDYTYNIFAYVAVQGYKYRLSDLTLTKQIAIEENNYCLEFYDPRTGATKKSLFEPSNLEAVNYLTAGSSLINEADGLAVELDDQRSRLNQNETDNYSVYQIYEFTKYVYYSDPRTVRIFLESIREVYERSIDRLGSDRITMPNFLDTVNTFATDAQVRTTNPYLADFNINIEPSLKIVEVPIQEETFKILDNPPNDIIATPHHLKDQSNRLAFFLSYDTFTTDDVPYPTTLTPEDVQNKQDYLAANDLAEGDNTQSESVSMAETIEVYRLSEKPSSYQDFEDNLRKTIDLRILKDDRIKLDTMFVEKVKSNQKYYYTFRAINENGIAGEFTPIFESELVNDGGYVYADFNQLTKEDLITDDISEPLMSFKKLFNVVPNIQHLILDSTAVDFDESAFDQVGNFDLGTAEDKIWGKTFKLRLTSKKTGKKIDLNIKFNNTKG